MNKDSKLNQPIIFFGTGRSGTTIISEIIFNHKDLAWPSNYSTKFPSFVQINYLRRLFQNRFWNLNGQKNQLNRTSLFNNYYFKHSESYAMWSYLTGPEIDFSRSFLINETANNRKIFIQNYFKKLVKYQGKERLAFKITGPSRINYLNSIFSDAIFIEVKRKPFPTISSLLKVPFWKERGSTGLWFYGAYRDDEIDFSNKIRHNPELITALQYAKLRSVAREELRNVTNKHLSINYEDFVENPELIIHKILNFVNLELDEGIKIYLERNKIFNRKINNEYYFDKMTSKNIEYIIDEKYELINL